jgi:peptidoglycan/LPS O-acetylase OafA/YrhL
MVTPGGDGVKVRSDLTVLRILLASTVIFSHAYRVYGLTEPSLLDHTLGRWALWGFFLLSGYLITSSWKAHPDPRRYAWRRIRRVAPGFAVAFIICVAIVAPLGGAVPPPKVVLDLLAIQPPDVPDVFQGMGVPELDPPMWSIRWELLCYILVPLLFGILKRPAVLLLAWPGMAVLSVIEKQDPGQAGLLLAFLTGAILTRWPAPRLPLPRTPDVSYGTYLYGWPIEKLLEWWGVTEPLVLFALALPLALGAGYLSHRFVEAPAMAWGQSRAAPGRPRGAAATGAGGDAA